MILECVTASTIARRLGVGVHTVTRAARRQGIGIYAAGRLLGVVEGDVANLKPVIHSRPGNPEWIAAGKKSK